MLVGGAVLSTLGFGRLRAVASGAARGVRGSAAARRVESRSAIRPAPARGASPIVTAILAGRAQPPIALGAWQASRDAESLRGWMPSLYPDQLVLNGLRAPKDAGELLAGARSRGDQARQFRILRPTDPDVAHPYSAAGRARRRREGDQSASTSARTATPGAFDHYQCPAVGPATPEISLRMHARRSGRRSARWPRGGSTSREA